MILTATTTPQRFPRFFQRMTLIAVQVKTVSGRIHLGSEQGEVLPNSFGGLDGVELSDTNTGHTAGLGSGVPYQVWWKGELWYAADVAAAGNVQFVVVVIGEVETLVDQRKNLGDVLGARIDALGAKLDALQKSGSPK